jgi:hypothetical protein
MCVSGKNSRFLLLFGIYFPSALRVRDYVGGSACFSAGFTLTYLKPSG